MHFPRRHLFSLICILLAGIAGLAWNRSQGKWRIHDLRTPAGNFLVASENSRVLANLVVPPANQFGKHDLNYSSESGASPPQLLFPAMWPRINLSHPPATIGISLPWWQVVLGWSCLAVALFTWEWRRTSRARTATEET